MSRDKMHYPSARLRSARRAIVARLYRLGYPYGRIVEELRKEEGMERTAISTVHNDVMALIEEWRQERLENIDDYVTVELQRIADATTALWDEFEKSRAGGGAGNVAYLAEIRQQLVERRKLLGLYAPERREVSGPGGAALQLQGMSAADIEAELARLAAGLPAAGGSAGGVEGA